MTNTLTRASRFAPTAPDDATLARLLDRITAMPTLAPRYAGLDGAPLNQFPVLTKDDFRTALPDTLRLARERTTGSLVLGSGGTTSAPKLSLMPSAMFVRDLRARWNPLRSDDILVNYDTPGRLCSSHNFYNRLADESGAVAVPLGAVDDAEMAQWLDFVEDLGATVLNATQTHLAHILDFCRSSGRTPPPLRAMLWTGEAFGRRAEDLVRAQLPDTLLYGCYGSTETWVIGHNGPRCPRDVFHLLPYQYVEIEDGQLLITSLHPDVINPIVRYRIGDRGEFVQCPCGFPGPSLHVTGRDDPQFKFLSILVSAQEIADAAREAEVEDVQVALIDHGTPHERIELRLTTSAGVEDDRAVEQRVRGRVLSTVYRMGYEVAAEPDAFAVRVVRQLGADARSQKTPLLVKEETHA